jgi:hypothetical protein
MAKQQRLNSLDRFRKQPGKLILEQHGHCEVPAGCGGVVLRWRNPHALVPFVVYVYSPVPTTCFLDGEPLRAARFDLAPGPHVVGFVLENVVLAGWLLMFAGVHDPKDYNTRLAPEVSEAGLKVLSKPDGTWKYSLAEPPEDWARLTFDDRGWSALEKAPTPVLSHQDRGHYACAHCVDLGASCIQLPERPLTVTAYVRKVFAVPAPRPGK